MAAFRRILYHSDMAILWTMGHGVSRVFSYTVRQDLWGSQLPIFLYDSE
jgi:hypothetical protein